MSARLPFRRTDITGDAALATDLLARAVVTRLDRGMSHREARAWVADPRQVRRFGPLASVAVETVITGGVR